MSAGTTPAPHAARTLNRWRRLGYRLLPGDGFSYILHLRPAEWPIMAAHTALGFLLAVGLAGAWRGQQLGTGLGALFIWVVLLNGGTLAINSVYDQDEGDIGYLDAPPRPPKYLLVFSWLLLILGQLFALTLPRGFAIAYAICFAMSVAYSVPPLRLKAVGGVDWLINMIGFGTLTPYAGWAATGRALPLPEALVLLAFCPLFAALYPMSQLYQWEEDSRRGDRTLAIMLGLRRSLNVAVLCTALAFGLLAWGAALRELSWWRWLAIGLAFAAWLKVLLPWQNRCETMTASEHQRGFYAALTAWGVTDVAVLLAFAL